RRSAAAPARSSRVCTTPSRRCGNTWRSSAMPDLRVDPAFVEALLAQDKAVTDAQYADYRRALDRKIADEARRLRFGRGRRRVGIALLLAAAAAIAVLVLRPRFAAERPEETPSNTVRPELV